MGDSKQTNSTTGNSFQMPEFQEEYWNEMESLIIADEKKKKRRILLFWLTGTTLPLLIGALIFLQFDFNSSQIGELSKRAQTFHNRSTSNKSISFSKKTTVPFSINKNSTELTSSIINSSKSYIQKASTSSSFKSNLTVQNLKDTSSYFANKKVIDQTSPRSGFDLQLANTSFLNIDSTIHQIIDLLPVKQFELRTNFELGNLQEQPIKNSYTHNSFYKKGVLLAHRPTQYSTSFYPDLEFQFWISKPLSKSIYLQSGIGYLSQTTSFNYSVKNTTYDFGSQSTSYTVKTGQLHFIKVPLQIGVKLQKVNLTGGVSIHYLTALQAQIDKSREEKFSSRKNWIFTDDFKSILPSFQISTSILITQHAKIGISYEKFLSTISNNHSFSENTKENRLSFFLSYQIP